tara:strand:+ start:267 stop:497 length:231 start_codon:yes stop_codon:yes gene_type:complete
MDDYTKGIAITAVSTAADYVKITNGVFDIDEVAVGISTFHLTSCTIDTTNNIVSGYDAEGVRYVFDKAANVTLSLV